MQKHMNLVDLVKSFATSIYLQKSASIQPREPLEVWGKIQFNIHSPPRSQNKLEAVHALVQSALKSEGGRCMPSEKKLGEFGVGPQYRDMKAFNIIYPAYFRSILAESLLSYFVICCIFFGVVSRMEPYGFMKRGGQSKNSGGKDA